MLVKFIPKSVSRESADDAVTDKKFAEERPNRPPVGGLSKMAGCAFYVKLA